MAIILGYVSKEESRAITSAGYKIAPYGDIDWLLRYAKPSENQDSIEAYYVDCEVTDVLVLEEPTPFQMALDACYQLVNAFEKEGVAQEDWEDLGDAYAAAKRVVEATRRPQ